MCPRPGQWQHEKDGATEMNDLTSNQYDIVVNVFSLTTTMMGVASIFFFLQRSEVLPRYRMGVTLLALMTLVSAYSYHELYLSWTAAYSVVNNSLKVSGTAFNEGFRYADWILTVPLLLVALVQVLDMPARQARVRSTILAVLAAEMVILGYPGQMSATAETRWLWWGIAMVPALIIVFQLYIGLSAAVAGEPEESRKLVKQARLLTIVSWSTYPIFFLFPLLGIGGSFAFAGMQVGYAAADILAKIAYGVLLYRVAAVKSAAAAEMSSALRTVKI